MTQQPYPPPPYGTPPAVPPPVPPMGSPLPKGQAVAALVCGIIGQVTSCLPIAPLVLGIIATALGAIGMKKARLGLASGRGMAIAGLILGIVTIVEGAIVTIWWMAVGGSMAAMWEAMPLTG